MSPVFAHGRLRLYLLKLLEEGPRHGYQMIRLLEDRFLGVYAPSAGTIYPRLSRLEEEGLVTHDRVGGRKVYRITDAGLQELRRRADELDELEHEISMSVRDLAREVTEDVRESVRGLREELKQATGDLRGDLREDPGGAGDDTWRQDQRASRDAWRERGDAWRHAKRQNKRAWRENAEAWRAAWEHPRASRNRDAREELDELIERFHHEVREAAQNGHVDEVALQACRSVLDDALTALRATLGNHRT